MPHLRKKRFILSVLTAALCISPLLSSCSKHGHDKAFEKDISNKEIKYYLALGVVLNTEHSEKGNAQVDITAAALLCDRDGRIRDCAIDCAQNNMDITDGVLTFNNDYLTKGEARDHCGMKQFSSIGKEWYEQAEFFSEYIVGMGRDEVSSIGTDGSDADLASGCTVNVTDMQKAVVKALESFDDDTGAVPVYDENAGLKLSAITEDICSKSATEDSGGIAAMYTVFCAAAVSNGRADAVIIDEAEPKILFNPSGEPYDKLYDGTKREQKDSYGMTVASDIGKEWYEQAEFFCGYIQGMSADEIAAIDTEKDGKTKEADLYCGCTVAVDRYIKAVVKALRS